MHLQCTMPSIFDWEVRRLGMRDTLKHGTITVSGFGYFHKNCRFLWGKMFQRQIQEEQYTIAIRHITNISDFVWFQRSFGSMKSVSSFSSIDTTMSGLLMQCCSCYPHSNHVHEILFCKNRYQSLIHGSAHKTQSYMFHSNRLVHLNLNWQHRQFLQVDGPRNVITVRLCV